MNKMDIARVIKGALLKVVALETVQNLSEKGGMWLVDPSVICKECRALTNIYLLDDPNIQSPNTGQSNPTDPIESTKKEAVFDITLDKENIPLNSQYENLLYVHC